MKYSLVFVWPLLMATPILAQSANQSLPGLPDAAVQEAIESHPRSLAADAKVEAARQEANALRVTSNEFTLSGDVGRRTIENDGRYTEYTVALERPIRLPGKSTLDRKAGVLGVRVAELRAEDARHQLALQLNEMWWDWVGAAAEARTLAETQQTLEQAYRAVASQVRVQDAAQVDADRAMAEVAMNRAAFDAALSRAGIARERLVAQFPQLALPAEAPAMSAPDLLPEERARLRDAVTTCNHELPAALAEADRLAALAERSRRNKIADPTIGAQFFSERGGMEKGAGIVFSIPLGGRYRAALSDQAAAEAQVAVADAATARFDVMEMATTDYSAAVGTVQAWKATEAAAASSRRAADRLQAGHRLGHVDLADLLFAERQAKEAALAEVMARATALRAETKLRIDAHHLWLDCSHDQREQP